MGKKIRVIRASTILAGVATVLALAMPVSSAAASAQAPASTDPYICLVHGDDPCIATNGSYNQVDVSTIGSRKEDFGESLTSVCGGTGITTSSCPFTLGSGLNVAGAEVVTFNNGGNCLFASGAAENEAEMAPCTSGDPDEQWAIYSNGDSGDFVVNVGYSDAEYAITHVDQAWYGLATGCDGSGCTVKLANVNEGGNFVTWVGQS
jgi:hypothetical protein